MTGPVRPHPLLAKHYVTLDQRPGYVQALFDDAAQQYERINRFFALGTGAGTVVAHFSGRACTEGCGSSMSPSVRGWSLGRRSTSRRTTLR